LFYTFFVTGILANIQTKKDRVEDAIDVEMQCDMLIILSSLCDGDIHRKVHVIKLWVGFTDSLNIPLVCFLAHM